ncbi:hypothetical protein [Anaerotignum propionicum]|nr:hypothetical protein [Anaerotignum propionicum]
MLPNALLTENFKKTVSIDSKAVIISVVCNAFLFIVVIIPSRSKIIVFR